MPTLARDHRRGSASPFLSFFDFTRSVTYPTAASFAKAAAISSSKSDQVVTAYCTSWPLGRLPSGSLEGTACHSTYPLSEKDGPANTPRLPRFPFGNNSLLAHIDQKEPDRVETGKPNENKPLPLKQLL